MPWVITLLNENKRTTFWFHGRFREPSNILQQVAPFTGNIRVPPEIEKKDLPMVEGMNWITEGSGSSSQIL